MSGPCAVVRWRRYGHDRLYVASADGKQLGYWDLATSSVHADPGNEPDGIEQAARHWLAGTGRSLGQVENEVEVGADEVCSDEPDWVDLGTTLAGAAARARARALRDAAPVRTVLARALGVKTDERAWRIGADGEEAVAAQLKKLGEGWHVLHAIPVGKRGSDIDHLVIGPAGVFTLNAKNHPDANVWVRGDTFKVNGQNVPYVRNSRHEAVRAARLLSTASGTNVAARGVVVIYGATRGVTIKHQPEDVYVVARRHVARWLRNQPLVLTGEQVDCIYEYARRSTTWQQA